MKKNITPIQKLAWAYAILFILVFVVSHWPGATDAAGRLFGLFKIDPIDDVFHLLSGLYALVAALYSPRASTIYFRIIGIPYIIDAITGLFFSREFLNLSVFIEGLGGPDFSTSNILINLPHIAIALVAFVIGFGMYRRLERNQLPPTLSPNL